MDTPTNCPVAHYCITGTIEPTQCPAGTYDNTGNLEAKDQCTDCDGGKYCDEPGLTGPKGVCEAGFFCSAASISPTPVDQTYGDLCPSGSYCPVETTTPQDCSAGQFNNYEGSDGP